jgi:hypothetical protein
MMIRTASASSRPAAIVQPILDMVAVSCAIVGASCEELGRCVNMGLLRPFTAPDEGLPFCHLSYNTAE